MATIQHTPINGKVLITSINGKIANECCCEGIDCLNDWPSMKLTIFDSDYSGGDISWCGETWTQSEIQSGVTKEVCPGYYIFDKTVQSTTYYRTTYYNHIWRRTGSLTLFRGLAVFNFQSGTLITCIFTNAINRLFVDLNGTYFGDYVRGSGNCVTRTITSTISSDLNMIIGLPLPTVGDYDLEDDYFGSHTSAGVLYTWEKGSRWP